MLFFQVFLLSSGFYPEPLSEVQLHVYRRRKRTGKAVAGCSTSPKLVPLARVCYCTAAQKGPAALPRTAVHISYTAASSSPAFPSSSSPPLQKRCPTPPAARLNGRLLPSSPGCSSAPCPVTSLSLKPTLTSQ